MQEIREVAQNVFRLGSDFFNFYLVRDGSRFTMIDGGLPGYGAQLTALVSRLGAAPSHIDSILVTHAHLDHLGIVERTGQEARARIWMHSGDARRAARGGMQLPPQGLLLNGWRPFVQRFLGHAIRKGVFRAPALRDFSRLDSLRTVDAPGSPEVIEMPGHTAGSVAFWLPDSRVLFAGDALVTLDMFRGSSSEPRLTNWRTNDDQTKAVESLASVAALGEATLLTGHGDPWHGDLALAVEGARRRTQIPAEASGDS